MAPKRAAKRKPKKEEEDVFIVSDDDSEPGGAGGAGGGGNSDSGYEEPKKKRKTTVKNSEVLDEPTSAPSTPGSGKKAKKPRVVRERITEATVEGDWTLRPPSLIYRAGSGTPNSKIAAFDFDGTVSITKFGTAFSMGRDDWQMYNAKVAGAMQDFAKQGYKIVIMSNQGGIKAALTGAGSQNKRHIFDCVIAKLAVPGGVTALMATQKDDMRKPEPGMWNFFVEELNGGQAPDLASSFYVGDAAGREGDFAATDKEFADRIGLPFKTPEEVFGKSAAGGGKADVSATGPNAELAHLFSRLAQLHKDNMWKSRAFSKAAAVLEKWPKKIASGKEAQKLEGIGKGTAAKIDEFLNTGEVAELKPEVQKAQEQADEVEAQKKATGEAFAFLDD